MRLAGQNIRGLIMDQERRLLGDATNAVQFLQANADGSRQGNLFLSSTPGATSYDGYNSAGNTSLNQFAVFGAGPVGAWSVAGP